ncbi:MAG TPA: PfkB family carbohydrate kinase [Jatrophihabitans sp.]|nr:PfkB family carbohydrate kinase [Jatrophihabitans sp.]
MTGRIVCVGDVMVDVLAQLPGPLNVASDTPAEIAFAPGGSGANTAAWLAWLGAPTTFAGRVGDDPFGAEAVAALRRLGVLTRVAIDFDRATGVCLVLVDPSGERTMVPSAGANAALTPADLTGLPAADDHLHLSGYSLLNEGSRAAALAVLAAARSVSVDAASAAPLRAVGTETFLSWLPPGTLLLANADELAALGGDPVALAGRGLTLVVKDGPAGARIADRNGLRTVATTPVAVRDSTGAGDAFAAGLLAARHAGASLDEAVAAGNRTGARALATLGGRPG